MRHHTLLLASFCSAASIILTTVIAVPFPANNQELDVLQIPLANGKEIDVLTLGSKDQEQAIAERNKRTIGLLRELFPDITKQIDDQANRIVSKILRAFGPTLLRTAIQGNTANRARSNFDADFDDDDDDNDAGSSSSSSDSSGTRVSIELPPFEPDDPKDNEIFSPNNSTTATRTTMTATTTGSSTTGPASETKTTTTQREASTIATTTISSA